MESTPAAESGSDLRCCLLEEGRPPPPVAAARNPTPPWLFAIRWFCIIAAAVMVVVFFSEVFPRCKSKEDVILCLIALAGALLTGPILGLALTACADADDKAARIPSRYTRSEENAGRAATMAVTLLGLYVIYLATVRGGSGDDRFQVAACYGMMGLGLIVGHSVAWVKGCFMRRD